MIVPRMLLDVWDGVDVGVGAGVTAGVTSAAGVEVGTDAGCAFVDPGVPFMINPNIRVPANSSTMVRTTYIRIVLITVLTAVPVVFSVSS